MQLNEKLQQAIRENLPEMVGKELQAILEQYSQDQSTLRNLEEGNTVLRQDNANLRDQISILTLELGQHRALEQREAEISTRERELELTILKERLQNAQQSKYDTMDLVKTIFKNPVLKETVIKGSQVFHTHPGCSYPVSQPVTEHTTHVREQE